LTAFFSLVLQKKTNTMKTKFISYILASVFLLSTLSGCDLIKSDDDQPEVDEYLLNYTKEKTYLPTYIKSFLDLAAGSIPEIAPIVDRIEHGITVYSITYLTEFEGKEIVASGLVSVPNSEETFPVLSYQNGTNTLHSKAPSVDPENQLFMLIEFIAGTGFITTIPDYLGFGSSSNMFHPYLHKESTVASVLDMQRATKELVKNHLEANMNDDLYIAGYSQGGWATMQVQKEIEENYSAEFDLKASACGAGPYNLNYINDYIVDQTTYPKPYFIGYLFNSYVNLGLSVPSNKIFQSPYDTKIMELFDGTRSDSQINDELTTTISELFTTDYRSGYNTSETYAPLLYALEENSVTAWKTSTPTLLIHGTKDTFVPPMVTSQLHQGFLLKGVGVNKVIMLPLPGEDHQSGILPSGLASIKWIFEIKDEMEM
jgi:pimeloyl-ACP methyl ester carboxylesterase